MRHEVEKWTVDGNGLDLEGNWDQTSRDSIVGFLAQHASRYPWFFGIASITIITVYPEPGLSDLVQLSGMICVAVITVISTWARRDYEQQGTAQFGGVVSDTSKN